MEPTLTLSLTQCQLVRRGAGRVWRMWRAAAVNVFRLGSCLVCDGSKLGRRQSLEAGILGMPEPGGRDLLGMHSSTRARARRGAARNKSAFVHAPMHAHACMASRETLEIDAA